MVYAFIWIAITAWYFYNVGYHEADKTAMGLEKSIVILANTVNEMQTVLNEHGIDFENEFLKEVKNGFRNN